MSITKDELLQMAQNLVLLQTEVESCEDRMEEGRRQATDRDQIQRIRSSL